MKKSHTGLAIIFVPMSIVAGCAPAPSPPAAYQQPDAYEAQSALRDALRRGLRGGVSAEDSLPKEGLNGTNFYATAGAQSREAGNDLILSKIDKMISPKISKCAWQSFDAGVLPSRRDPPTNEEPEAAYLCEFTERYGAAWGTSAARGIGYFYRHDDKWVYDGEEVHGYKKE